MVFVPKNQAGVKVHELHSNYPKLDNFFIVTSVSLSRTVLYSYIKDHSNRYVTWSVVQITWKSRAWIYGGWNSYTVGPLSLYLINQRPWDCCPRFDFFLLILLPRILTILILMCKKGGGNNPKLNKIIDPQSIDCVLASYHPHPHS